METDLYGRLGVTKKASDGEIKLAYRTKAKNCHPDLFPGDKDKEQRFEELKQARDVLLDEKSRSFYDSTGHILTTMRMDEISAKALSAVVNQFMSIVEKEDNPEFIDIIGVIKQRIPEMVSKLDGMRLEFEKKKQKYQIVKERLVTLQDENFISRSLDHSIATMDANLLKVVEEEHVVQTMNDLLQNYSFNAIQRMVYAQTVNYASTPNMGVFRSMNGV